MTESNLPLAYRWFVAKGLTNLQPWYFVSEADATNPHLIAQFRLETGADFDVRLFARRQDRDDFAFFVTRAGQVEDRVISIHLSFVKKFELRSPLLYTREFPTFMDWVHNRALVDVADWMSEDDLSEPPAPGAL
jgi:hypothetical protein